MNERDIIRSVEEFVKVRLKDFDSGHNWWHIERVRRHSSFINNEESIADPFIVDLAALMHDVADSKFKRGFGDDPYIDSEEFLNNSGLKKSSAEAVIFVMRNISFSSGYIQLGEMTPELMVVQDADRLDAIGAIGIARAFNYGGFRKREIYDPEEFVKLNMSKEEYKKSDSSTINHFYEKLLLLKGLMNTDTGRRLAEERHQFMELFLAEFYKEWNLK